MSSLMDGHSAPNADPWNYNDSEWITMLTLKTTMPTLKTTMVPDKLQWFWINYNAVASRYNVDADLCSQLQFTGRFATHGNNRSPL